MLQYWRERRERWRIQRCDADMNSDGMWGSGEVEGDMGIKIEEGNLVERHGLDLFLALCFRNNIYAWPAKKHSVAGQYSDVNGSVGKMSMLQQCSYYTNNTISPVYREPVICIVWFTMLNYKVLCTSFGLWQDWKFWVTRISENA